MDLLKFITFSAIENGGDVAGNVALWVVTSQTITSLNNANNQQFQTARSGSNFPALVFWWDFPVPGTRKHYEAQLISCYAITQKFAKLLDVRSLVCKINVLTNDFEWLCPWNLKMDYYSLFVHIRLLNMPISYMLRDFFPKWLKWRSYSPFADMLFVNLLHLMDVWSKPLSLSGNPNFVNKLHLYTFNIQFMYKNLNFSFLLHVWN